MSLHIHVVSHTHWDREWYQPAERFRQRLVALIDELLDAPPAVGESFLLDGQTIVLDDYLAVRPDRGAALEELIRAGRIESGPWFVLADELIPSGEAIVRNLLAGRRALRAIGASSPPVLYCPDSFGHPAMLPAIARGFGLELVILWRGFGGDRWPRTDVASWCAPNGDHVLLYHLSRDGYELGASLPVDAESARIRWQALRVTLVDRSTLGVALLLNGADHHARQRDHHQAMKMLREAAGGDTVQGSSLTAFATALIAATAGQSLPAVTGELRDSFGYTWALQGTFSTRAAQKRRNACVERVLVREAEPWSALAMLAGARSRNPLVRAAWRSLLTSHPHDTLCGCSIDEVARAADVRTAAAEAQAIGVRDDAVMELIGHDADRASGQWAHWRPVVVVRNGAARPRGGVAIVELQEFIADEPVGPGSGPIDASVGEHAASLPSLTGARALQRLGWRIDRDRIESARHYPDNDVVRASRIAAWVDPVPALGLVSLPIDPPQRRRGTIPNQVRARGTSLDNQLVALELDRDGQLTLHDRLTGATISRWLTLEHAGDRGDLYTASLDEPPTEYESVRARVVHRGPLVGEMLISWPVSRSRGSAKGRQLAATVRSVSASVSLQADSPLVRVRIRGDNQARDYRLRIGIATGVREAAVWADAAFGAVERRPVIVSAADREMETPPKTDPLHRYVSLFAGERGATVFGDGLAEYEVAPDGRLFVTLLRCVGQLSRNDLLERPGHAGWPAATPEAQSPGPFEAGFALLCHRDRSSAVIDAIERASDDFLVPLVGTTVRNALDVHPAVVGAELTGTALAFSAVKESESGGLIVLRCVNLSDEEHEGSWRLPTPVREAWTARLDETPLQPIPANGPLIRFRAGPREIVTLLARAAMGGAAPARPLP